NAYPHLLHVGLKERFPYAVVNVVVTAIGGENSIQGAKRFDADVLPLKPDVVTIDYGLNDRGIPMEATKKAWTEMVRKCQHKGIKVLLLTPSPDQSAKIFDEHDPLSLQTAQIRQIANDTGVGLVDVYHRFQDLVRGGAELPAYMSQVNHPNRKGHEEITAMLLPWFLTPKPPK
ncbi:MAG: SGNH/GDSL hydrolase family protein, partial [Armatimonadetes bacterium]|nr:SGNH/GDSL hydrolase family protein [Armatimonadota bacterium]